MVTMLIVTEVSLLIGNGDKKCKKKVSLKNTDTSKLNMYHEVFSLIFLLVFLFYKEPWFWKTEFPILQCKQGLFRTTVLIPLFLINPLRKVQDFKFFLFLFRVLCSKVTWVIFVYVIFINMLLTLDWAFCYLYFKVFWINIKGVGVYVCVLLGTEPRAFTLNYSPYFFPETQSQ